jgi:hypothetical protein
MHGGLMPPCPVCARRSADAPRPTVQRVSDGSELETDVLRGPSLVTEELEPDELPATDASVVAVTIPSLPSDDVIQLRFPRACLEAAPAMSLESAEQSVRRPANVVVLPQRWYLLEATVPTIVSRTRKGCIRIEFDAPVDDAGDTVLTIVRHALPAAM